MKHQLIILFGLFLILIFGSFKTPSIENDDLLIENQLLKEQIAEFETIDSSKSKTVIELNKLNVVYRSFTNPMSISMPDAVKFEASAPGLKKIDDFGHYELSPGSGLKVDVLINGILSNGDKISDIKSFRIIDIGRPVGTINDFGCRICTVNLKKDEFINGSIDVQFNEFLFDLKFRVYRFKVRLPDEEIIEVYGNKINKEVMYAIEKLKVGDKVNIFDIKIMCIGVAYKMPIGSPIDIEIIE